MSDGHDSGVRRGVFIAMIVIVSAFSGGLAGAMVLDQYGSEGSDAKVNMSAVVSDNDVASYTQRGPEGTATFTKHSNGSWTVDVTVNEWNSYEMLMVYAYKDPYTEQRFLHPGDNSTTLRNVPNESFVDLHIPVEKRYGLGYIWEEEYWLDNSVEASRRTEFESDVLITAVESNYSTKAEGNNGE